MEINYAIRRARQLAIAPRRTGDTAADHDILNYQVDTCIPAINRRPSY